MLYYKWKERQILEENPKMSDNVIEIENSQNKLDDRTN